jgi:hypothetical protein
MTTLFSRCTHCSSDLAPGATYCPECGAPVEREGRGNSRKAALILLALVFVAGAVVGLRTLLKPKGKEAVSPDGQKFIQAPEYSPKEPSGFKCLIHVTELAQAHPDRLKVILSNELGPEAKISNDRIAGQWQWVALIFTPPLANSTTRIEVMPYKNRVTFIKLRFQTRYPDRAEMLTLLGLEPHMAKPSMDAMEGPVWTYFCGFDEIRGVYESPGGPGIREVTITPNKALANFFLRGGQ